MKQWMMFVDGENLTREAERRHASVLVEGHAYIPGTFVWMPDHSRRILPDDLRTGHMLGQDLAHSANRWHYFTCSQGAPEKLGEIRKQIHAMGFQPDVFVKTKGRPSKGVDISLATEMLSGAFINTYEAAVLVAGDADYRPLVEAVKRQGKMVYVLFFDCAALSDDLRLAADRVIHLDESFVGAWKAWRSSRGLE